MFHTPVCRFTCSAWFSCNKFINTDSLVSFCWTHRFPFSVLRSNATVGAKKKSLWSQARYQSHSLASFTGRPMVYNLEVFCAQLCVCTYAVRVWECQIRIATCFCFVLFCCCFYSLPNKFTSCVCDNCFWFRTDFFLREKWQICKH